LESLQKTANVQRSCTVARIPRSSLYDWRDEDLTFQKDWDKALKIGLLTLQDIAVRRASKDSDTVLIFLLKAHWPERYREHINLNATVDQTVRTIPLTREELTAELLKHGLPTTLLKD
jgi:hypothetical protein